MPCANDCAFWWLRPCRYFVVRVTDCSIQRDKIYSPIKTFFHWLPTHSWYMTLPHPTYPTFPFHHTLLDPRPSAVVPSDWGPFQDLRLHDLLMRPRNMIPRTFANRVDIDLIPFVHSLFGCKRGRLRKECTRRWGLVRRVVRRWRNTYTSWWWGGQGTEVLHEALILGRTVTKGILVPFVSVYVSTRRVRL